MEKKALQLFDLDAEVLRISGPDAGTFLQGMITADLKRASSLLPAQGAGGGAFLLDLKGKIVAPSKYFVFENNHYFFVVPAGSADLMIESLERLHITEDFEITKIARDAIKLYLGFGSPTWPSVEEILVPKSVPSAQDEIYKIFRHDWGLELPTPEWGDDGCLFFVEDQSAFESSHEIRSLTPAQFEEQRIRCGIPKWNQDFNAESLVLEFPHMREISFHKGCYLGQEVVARASYRGSLPKAFFRFEAAPDQVLKLDFVYNTDAPEKAVGKLTSVSGPWGLGQLRGTALSSGALFQVADDGKKIEIVKAEALTRVRT